MGLITKPPSWGHCTTSYSGTPAAGGLSSGVLVTASSGANVDGSSLAVITNLTHDVEFLQIGYAAGNTSTTEVNMLLDILIDPAGGTSWGSVPLINDLLVGFSPNVTSTSPPQWFHFPIWIKSGSSIGARVRSSAASDNVSIWAIAQGGNANPSSWWCGSAVETIGVNPASSVGTNHTPGSSGAFSAWTDFGSALTAPCGALQFAMQGSTATALALGYYFEFGVDSTRIGPNYYKTLTTSEVGMCLPWAPVFCALPTGTQLQVRATCSGAPQAIDVAAYAVN